MLNEFNTLVTRYQAEAASYASKPTKAASKRMRDLINKRQKLAVETKRKLISLDKGE